MASPKAPDQLNAFVTGDAPAKRTTTFTGCFSGPDLLAE